MKNCIFIVIFFCLVNCGNENPNQKRSNDKETYHRLNFVNLVLPKEYKPLTAPDIFGPEYEWLTKGLNLQGTESKTIFYKKENDEILSFVQIDS